jgi:hypothetical protein
MVIALGLVPGCGGDAERTVPLPLLADRGGPVMAHPQLVPILFADDADGDALVQFTEWIATSSWLTAVGAEYGVGHGAVLGVVRQPEAAPAAITDDEIAGRLFRGLDDGTIPRAPADDPAGALYLFHLPARTVVTAGGATSCVQFGNYHASTRFRGREVAYAVIPTCPGRISGHRDLEIRQLQSSHVIIEAATDPFPNNHPGFQVKDPTSPWRALGGEVADLCVWGDATSTWREGGFVAQRSWSNAEAAAGEDPCVPGQAEVYFNLFSETRTVLRIPPGGHEKVMLGGWSPRAKEGLQWDVFVDPAQDTVTVALDMNKMTTQTHAALDISVAAGAARGFAVGFYVYSRLGPTHQVLPMFAIAADPCSSYSGCEECTSHYGCGYCGSIGRCEAVGPSGASASCSDGSFARWTAACPGACASHGASCGDCTSVPGCGWCDSGVARCVEADEDLAGPETGSCDYASWSVTPNYCPG